jgi:hypothetical protein
LFTATSFGGGNWRRYLTTVFNRSYVHCVGEQVNLPLEYLFNLSDFLLDFACEFFVLAFGLQAGVVRDLSGFLFNVALQFMKLAFDLIFRARFHLVSPLFFRKQSCYPRQREYPHPPPPSKNTTRRTINKVVISHLFAIPVQCRFGTKADCVAKASNATSIAPAISSLSV